MHGTMTEESCCRGDNFTATRKRLENSGYMYFILPNEGVEAAAYTVIIIEAAGMPVVNGVQRTSGS